MLILIAVLLAAILITLLGAWRITGWIAFWVVGTVCIVVFLQWALGGIDSDKAVPTVAVLWATAVYWLVTSEKF